MEFWFPDLLRQIAFRKKEYRVNHYTKHCIIVPDDTTIESNVVKKEKGAFINKLGSRLLVIVSKIAFVTHGRNWNWKVNIMSELKPEEMRVHRFGAIRSWLRPKYGLFDLNPLGPDNFFSTA